MPRAFKKSQCNAAIARSVERSYVGAMKNPREILPIVPLRSLVMFPGVAMTLDLGGPGQTQPQLVAEMAAGRAPRVLIIPRGADDEELKGSIGVTAEVKHVSRRPRGNIMVVFQGLERARVVAPLQLEPFLTAEVEPVEEIAGEGPEHDALVRTVRDRAVQLLREEEASPETVTLLEALDSPARLADQVATVGSFRLAEARAVLAELDVQARLSRALAALERRLAERAEAARLMQESDPKLREKVLREKMAEIQAQLGESPDADDEWNRKIAAAELPPEVEQVARRELRRVRGETQSPDAEVARNYLDCLLELPWSKLSTATIDLDAARGILAADHSGLEKIKRRIVEYLAVRKLNPAKKGPILLLVGPPGVGKTSLGRSIAKALGREYVRVSLGGVRDEAEIRGHRRTYIGARPGRIMQALRRAGTRNPVFVLDEIDKLGAGVRGDPQAALLEVLDPEQNFAFSDHYVELPFDLSEVVFIATANDLSTISGPLRDRMEVLPIAGYTTSEKRAIAEAHLVPGQLVEHGLAAGQVGFGAGALEAIIEGHTREAGVRNLEREIAKVVRGVAVKVASGDSARAEIGVDQLDEYLGPPHFYAELAERDARPGVATGLAWTPTGGEILFIEATLMPGKGQLKVTGQLGEVMRESVQAALSYVRSHALEHGIAPDVFEKHDVHVHVPAGAVPKDGPSAGNAIATALVSLFSERAVRGDVAMTGEITLRGHVLPVGGIASKVLAAHRAGIRRVILPAKNAKDLVEIPAEVREAIDIRLVSRLHETLDLALEAPVPAGIPSVANGNQPAAAIRIAA